MRKSARLSSIGASKATNSAATFSTRFSLPSFIKRVKLLTDDQIALIEKMGFGSLLLIPNHTLSRNLLVELMESWSIEKHAFILHPGECHISSMDVALILGLRVVGPPVQLRDDEPFSDLESEYGAAPFTRKISVASLESRLDSLAGICNDDFVRTFLLYTFGTFLFPSASGKVDSRYLSFLKNLDSICEFAWGAAVLQDIWNWLDRRKEANVQYVGGCVIFLQIWSYEHIDVARPSLLESGHTFPRICRWDNCRSLNKQRFTSQFKDLEDHQVILNELQLTSREMEVEIIKELMEAQNQEKDHLKGQDSIINLPVVGDFHISNRSQMANQQYVEVEADSKTSEDDVTLDCLVLPQKLPEVLTESMDGHSSTSCSLSRTDVEAKLASLEDSSLIVISDDEDDLRSRVRMLEEQNMEMKKEIDELKRENELLRNQLSSGSDLKLQNIELKREVDELRRENQLLSSSSNNLVTQLEKLLLDADASAAEE